MHSLAIRPEDCNPTAKRPSSVLGADGGGEPENHASGVTASWFAMYRLCRRFRQRLKANSDTALKHTPRTGAPRVGQAAAARACLSLNHPRSRGGGTALKQNGTPGSCSHDSAQTLDFTNRHLWQALGYANGRGVGLGGGGGAECPVRVDERSRTVIGGACRCIPTSLVAGRRLNLDCSLGCPHQRRLRHDRRTTRASPGASRRPPLVFFCKGSGAAPGVLHCNNILHWISGRRSLIPLVVLARHRVSP